LGSATTMSPPRSHGSAWERPWAARQATGPTRSPETSRSQETSQVLKQSRGNEGFLGKRVKPESSKNEIHPPVKRVRFFRNGRDSQRGWKWQLSNLLPCFLVSCKMIIILILMSSLSPNPKADAITPSKEQEHII